MQANRNISGKIFAGKKDRCLSVRSCLRAIGILLTGFLVCQARGQNTYYSKVATGNINSVGSWTADTVNNPNASPLTTADTFVIREGHTITFNATTFTVGKLTVRSGGTLSPSGSRTLVSADPVEIEPGGTLDLNIRNLSINCDFENNGLITGTSGQITVAGAGKTFTNNGSFETATGRINITATTLATVVNNGTISATGAGRIIITDGSFTNNGSLTMGISSQIVKTTGLLANGPSGTIFIGSDSTATMTMGEGDFINQNLGSSVNFSKANITITDSAADQKIGGFVTRGRLSCTKTFGKVTLTGDIVSTGLTMNGAGGTMDLGSGLTHTTNGTVVLTAGTLYGGTNTTLNVAVVNNSAWGGALATVFDPGTGTVNFNAAGDQRISTSGGERNFYNLIFSNSGMKFRTTTALTVANIFSVEDDATTGTTANQVPTLGAAATLRYNTSTPRTSGPEWPSPFVSTGGVVIENTAAITTDGDKELAEGVPLTINSGATLTVGTDNFTFGGDFINNGTWTPSSGDITITGTVGQDIGNFSTTGTVHMTKTNGVAILQGDINAGGLEMNGDGGTLRLGAGHTHTISGTWTNTDGIMRGNSSVLNVDGDVSGSNINFIANNSTVHFRGSSPQTIPDFTFNDLELSGAGIKTLSGTTTVEGVLTVQADAELDLLAQTLVLSSTGEPLLNNGLINTGTSTIQYNAAGSATIAALDYYNLDASGGDRVFSVTDTIGVAGTFTPGSGTYDISGSKFAFNGSGDQDLPSFVFNDLFLSNAGSKKIPASIVVSCKHLQIKDSASLQVNGAAGGRLNLIP